MGTSSSQIPSTSLAPIPGARAKVNSALLPEERFFVITDLEDAIAQLPKVRGVRVVATETEIEEIHVISAKDIAPKSLVRDIISLLFVRFGVRVDRRFLSIVQSDEEPRAQVGRPIIASVTQKPAGANTETWVELRSGRQVVLGSHTAASDGENMRCGGLALIDAVENLIGRRRVIDLNEVKIVEMTNRNLVIVLVTWHGARADESFVGSALSENNPPAAAARATLDAINRKLIRLPIMSDS